MSASFGGSDAYSISSNNWPTSSNTRTIAFWVYITDVTARQELLYYGAETTNQRFLLDSLATGKLEISFLGHSASSTGVNFSNTTWHHVAATVHSTTSYEIFVDGSSVATGSGTINTASSTGYLAGNLGAIANLTGRIAEVAVWNVQLSTTDIGALAKGFTPQKIRPDALVWYSPLIRETVIAKGSGTYGTTGSPSVADHPRIIK